MANTAIKILIAYNLMDMQKFLDKSCGLADAIPASGCIVMMTPNKMKRMI